MAGDWLRHDRADLAVDRILDAAEAAIIDKGVPATTMADIASRAGCSRATVYAYFPNRHELRVAVVNRAAVTVARRVAEATEHLANPRERLVESVLYSVRAVRSTPALAAWFTPASTGYAQELTRSSEVIEAIAAGLATSVGPEAEVELRSRWLIRVIVSLLTMPAADESEERALVERFVVPALVADSA